MELYKYARVGALFRPEKANDLKTPLQKDRFKTNIYVFFITNINQNQ